MFSFPYWTSAIVTAAVCMICITSATGTCTMDLFTDRTAGDAQASIAFGLTQEVCIDDCLKEVDCVAAIFKNSLCLKWYDKAHLGTLSGSTLYEKVCSTPVYSCPPHWMLIGESLCFKAYNGHRSFAYSRARSYCKSEGGDLATNVISAWRRQRMGKLMKFSGHFWVGLDDLDKNGVYKDINEVAVTDERAFKRGIPKQAGRCITYKRRRLFPKDCSKKFRVICQKAATLE